MSCSKVPYPDRAAALADIQQIKTNRKWRSKRLLASPKAGRRLRTYCCRYCGKWHLTSQKPRKNK